MRTLRNIASSTMAPASAVSLAIFLMSAAQLALADFPHDHRGHFAAEQADKMVMDEPRDDHEHDIGGMPGMDNKTHMMMQMYFHFGVSEYVLFKEWKTSDAGGMVASVIGIFILGLLYEGLKHLREFLHKKQVSSLQFSTVAITGENGKVTQVHKVEKHRMLSSAHAVQTMLHVVQIVLSYFLMLIFMTYNVWLCLGVVLGSGAGYFIFGWRKASVVDMSEHCH